MNPETIYAIILTSAAGLATGIGGLAVFFTRRFNGNFLSVSMGFSAGVMILIALSELLPESWNELRNIYGERGGTGLGLLAFFAGIAATMLIDRLIPENENPHELNFPVADGKQDKGLAKIGIISALAIAVHNFPEGMATFSATATNPDFGITMAVAIALHNIPEGIAIAVPLAFSGKSRSSSFILAMLSGLAEPIGGLAGYLLLSELLGTAANGMILGFISGIMVYISIDELLPAAEKYGKHHMVLSGVLAGMAFMGLTLAFV